MLALRYAALLGAALWTGGLLALGLFAAPAIFEIIAARGIADGRVLAGAIFGETLRRFHLFSYACGAVILGSLLLRAALGPRPAQTGPRIAIAAAMLGTALFSGIYLSSRIDRARADAGGAPSALAEGDPRRATFGRLHAASTILQIVPVLGGLALLFWELRDR
jgi:hypothetical protein